MNYKNLTQYEKVAILIMTLGKKEAALVLRQFDKPTVEKITYALSRLKKVPDDIAQKVVKEFHDLLVDYGFVREHSNVFKDINFIKRKFGTYWKKVS